MVEEVSPPSGGKTTLVTDLKVGDVIIDGRGSSKEVTGVDASGKWAIVHLRAEDGLEIESSYNKDKTLMVISAPKSRCAECGAPVLDDKVNGAGLPICHPCDAKGAL